MRDYGAFSPLFWTRGSGKRLRGDAVAQIVAAYLATAPTSNLIGIYYLPIVTICNDTGHTEPVVRAALERIERVGFAFYDEGEELVWIPNHAEIQVGLELKEKDHRRQGVARALRAYSRHRFAHEFMARYGEAYGLDPLPSSTANPKPLEAPRSPLKPLTRGYDPDPDPVSDLSLDPDLSPDPGSTPPVAMPARVAIPRHVANLEGPSWVETYRQSVQATIGGGDPWSFDPRWLRDLERVLNAHSEAANRMGREPWIQETVTAFVTAMRGEGEFWMGFSPKGLEKWLNLGRPKPRAKAQPKRRFGGPSERDLTEPDAYPGPIVTTWDEELAKIDAEEKDKGTNGKGYPRAAG